MNDKNLYTIEAITSDLSFISWVNNNCPKDEYWSERLKAEPTLINPSITQANSLKFMEEPDVNKKQQLIWSKIDGKISGENTPSVSTNNNNRRNIIYMIAGAAAACMLALFMILPSSKGDYHSIVATDQNASVKLPDQSKVDVRKGSSINYDATNWGDILR